MFGYKFYESRLVLSYRHYTLYYPYLPLITPMSGTNTRRILEDFEKFFYVVSTIYAKIFSFLRICSRSL